MATVKKSTLLLSCLTVILLFSCGGKIDGTAKDKTSADKAVSSFSYPEWSSFRNYDSSGISEDDNWDPMKITDTERVLWKKSVGKGYSTPVISGKYLVIQGEYSDQGADDAKDRVYMDTVQCLDSSTATELWKFEDSTYSTLYPGPRSTSLIAGNKVYSLLKRGLLVCLGLADGSLIWKRDLRKEEGAYLPLFDFGSSPRIIDNQLIINAGNAGMAFDPETGKTIWTNGGGKGGYASAVLFNDAEKPALLIFSSEALYLLERVTGKIMASFPWVTQDGINASDPIVMGKRVFVSSSYKTRSGMLEYSNGKFTQIWKNNEYETHMTGAILIDGYLYVNDHDANLHRGRLLCVDPANGSILWQEDTGVSSITAAGGYIICLTDKGIVKIVKAAKDKYTLIAERKIVSPECHTSPVFNRNILYLRNLRGDLFAIDMSK
jgi:outer membrane protein assembly factor BamB